MKPMNLFFLIFSELFMVKSIYADDSQYNEQLREKNNYYGAGQVSALTGPGPGVGGKIGWRQARLAAEMEFNYTDIDTSLFGLKEVYSYSSAINAKYFFSDIFYWSGGAYFRHTEIDKINEIFCHTDCGKTYASSKFDSIGGEFFIGSQWEFAHGTLGLDWIGFSIPFTTFNQSTYSVAPGIINPPSAEDKIRPYLLRLYSGITF
jgi:hypothetical protein